MGVIEVVGSDRDRLDLLVDVVTTDAVFRGGRVLFVGASHDAARDAHEYVQGKVGDHTSKVSRSHGSRSIRFYSGGVVWFVSARGSSGRGIDASTVFVDDVPNVDGVVVDVVPCVMATNGRIVVGRRST